MEENFNETSEMKMEKIEIEENQSETSEIKIDGFQEETFEKNTEENQSENTTKVVDRKKMILATIVLLILLITTGIYAYFTSTKTATNVFTIGSIEINLTEGDDWDTASENGEAPEGAQNIEPGQHITKAPNVENVGKNPAYVYLKVYVPVNNEDNLFSYTINETDGETGGWTQRVGEEMHTTIDGQVYNIYVYEYDETLEPGTTTEQALFDEVIFADGIYFTPEQVAEMGNVKKIIIKAYAIQSELGVEKSSNVVTDLALGDSNEERGLVSQIQVGDKFIGDGGTVSLVKGASNVPISLVNGQVGTYTSSETSVATVSNEGMINAVDIGTTTISVSGSGIKSKEISLNVVEAIENATVRVAEKVVTPETTIMINPGAEKQITIDNLDTIEEVEYSISPTTGNISVDSTGKITAEESAEGGETATVTITGKLSGTTKTIQVKVSELTEGQLVRYVPAGTYTWDKTYATANSTDTIALDAKGNCKITDWRILSIDGDTVNLVPANGATTQTVNFQGAQGYNNAVQLLNIACSELYKDTTLGITARSINIEDFEKAQEVADYRDEKITGTIYNYSGKWRPTIYADEMSGAKTMSQPISTSNTDLIERNEASKLGGEETTFTGKNTYYELSNSELSAKLGGLASKLLPNGSSTDYWVASRCADAWSGNCYFTVRAIRGGKLDAHWAFFTNSFEYETAVHGFFPVISVNAEHLSKVTDQTYMYEVK